MYSSLHYVGSKRRRDESKAAFRLTYNLCPGHVALQIYPEEIVSAKCMRSACLLGILKPGQGFFKVFTGRRETDSVELGQVSTRQTDLSGLLILRQLLRRCPSQLCRKERDPGACLFDDENLTRWWTSIGVTIFCRSCGKKLPGNAKPLVSLYHHKLKHFFLLSCRRHRSRTYFFKNMNFVKCFCVYIYDFVFLKQCVACLFLSPITRVFGTSKLSL